MADSIIPVSMPGGNAVPGLKPVSCGIVQGASSINIESDWDIICITTCFANFYVISTAFSAFAIGPVYGSRPNSTASYNIYLPVYAYINQPNTLYVDATVLACTVKSTSLSGPGGENSYWASYILYKLDT